MSVELPVGSPEFWADPYPTWAALRDDQPVYWWETAGAWVVFDHEHALDVLRDDEGYSLSRATGSTTSTCRRRRSRTTTGSSSGASSTWTATTTCASDGW